ncbi:MAG: ATP-binding protein, partial [Elainellaceae cyanobacterium]
QREEEILQRQSATLAQLSHSRAIAQGDLAAAFQELTEETAHLLQVERVSIWLFDDEQAKIHCATLFQLSRQMHSNGCELTVADYSSYFAAVLSNPVLAVDNVRADPSTCELIDGYLDVFQISSMLDASFDVDRECRGIICCEHTGVQRAWSQAEQNVIRSVANLVALTIEVNQRHQKAELLERALVDLKQSQFQMIHSEKMATLGQLISGIAHEINNPVSFIYGNLPHAKQYISDLMALIEQYQAHYPNPPTAIATALETIELDFLQDDLNKLLQSMQVGSERIHTIIKSMGNFSRLDESEIEDADIHAGIDNSLLLLNTRLRAQHWRPAIRIVKDYGNLPSITCRAGQINQVLMNLLNNAIDALEELDRERYSKTGPEGAASEAIAQPPSTIEIRTRSQPQSATPSIIISVKDNGIGMSQTTRDRLFEAFFTTKPVGKGTGLGLSISHQIVVKNHGGHLSCSSEPGQGTTFTVTLPCHNRATASRPALSESIAY